MPLPVSFMDICAFSPFSLTVTYMKELSWLNFIALSIRLYMTCWIFCLSAFTFSTFPANVRLNLIFFFLHVPSSVSIVCFMTEFTSNVLISRRTLLGSSSLRVSILLVSLVSLSVSKSTMLIYLLIISGGIVPSSIASR